MFDPLNLFWAGVVMCYVMQPVSYAKTFINWHDEHLFVLTLFWILFGLVWVVVGYELPMGNRWGKRVPAMPGPLSPGRLGTVAMVAIGLGLFGYAYAIKGSGGMAQWLSFGRGGTDYEKNSTYLIELEDMLTLGVILLIFRAEIYRKGGFMRLIAWALGALLWLWFLYLGSRSHMKEMTLVFLMAWYMPRHRNPPLLLIIPVFFALMVVSNFQRDYREQFTDLSFHLDTIDWNEAKQRCLPRWLQSGKAADYEEPSARGIEFNCVMEVIRLVPKTVPYNYGWGNLEVFTHPIPRALWPGKRWPALEAIQGVLREAQLSESYGGLSNQLTGPLFPLPGIGIISAGRSDFCLVVC